MIYNLELSTKKTLQITEEEKNKFVNNIKASFITIGEAIINPSFVVSITVDKEASRQERLNNTPQLPTPEKDVSQIRIFLKKHNPKFTK